MFSAPHTASLFDEDSRLIATDIFRICSEIFFDFYSGICYKSHCVFDIFIKTFGKKEICV